MLQDDLNLEYIQRDKLMRELRRSAELRSELHELRRQLAADFQAAAVAAGAAKYAEAALQVQPLCRLPSQKQSSDICRISHALWCLAHLPVVVTLMLRNESQLMKVLL